LGELSKNASWKSSGSCSEEAYLLLLKIAAFRSFVYLKKSFWFFELFGETTAARSSPNRALVGMPMACALLVLTGQ